MSHSVSETIPENSEMKLDQDIHEHLTHIASPHRRTRTLSETERIQSGPVFKGTITEFCRNKGHGFIKPDDGSEPIFLHISDIEGQWVPKEGDIVSYKKALMPPKMQKCQAVHCHLTHLKDGVKHEHWDFPSS